MTKSVQVREFRPARPPLKELLPTAFLAAILAIVAPQVVARPTSSSVLGVVGCGLLVVGGLWLYLRDRWPGDPVLRVDADGLSYTRSGKTKKLAWAEVCANPVDFTLKRMSFVPSPGKKAITMRHRMVAEDGTDWLMVIEEYWRGPRKARR